MRKDKEAVCQSLPSSQQATVEKTAASMLREQTHPLGSTSKLTLGWGFRPTTVHRLGEKRIDRIRVDRTSHKKCLWLSLEFQAVTHTSILCKLQWRRAYPALGFEMDLPGLDRQPFPPKFPIIKGALGLSPGITWNPAHPNTLCVFLFSFSILDSALDKTPPVSIYEMHQFLNQS